jgi:hypothetical protein
VKGISVRARFVLGIAVLVVVTAYVVVVDLGVNAGRIHRGVSVGTIDVGGMTQSEAADRLQAIGREMRDEPITFEVGSLVFEISPADLKWRPSAGRMARRAMMVGREGGLAHAASERWRAWFGGVQLMWSGAGGGLVDQKIQELGEELDASGYDLDEEAMARALERAIWDWPRRDSYEVPLASG